jgi:Na+-driven multidrug efflux pump
MPSPTRRKWRFLREALAGTTQDFTQGSLTRGIALLAIPTILEMVMESTFGVVDAFWVARLGPDAMAAVGLTEAVIVIVFAIAMGLATAATATVARRIGEHDPEGASVAAVQAIGGGACSPSSWERWATRSPRACSSSCTPRPPSFRRGRLRAHRSGRQSGHRDAVPDQRHLPRLRRRRHRHAHAVDGQPDQHGARPLLHLWTRPVPETRRDRRRRCHHHRPQPGRGLSTYVLGGGRARVAVARRHLRLDWPVLARLLRVARTAMLQYFIGTASWLTLARINAGFGSNAVAGYSLAIRIIMFALMPSWGICSAAATLVGQNLGAKRPDRSERAVWLAGPVQHGLPDAGRDRVRRRGAPAGGAVPPGALVVPIAVTCLQYVSLGYPFYAWGMVMEQAFNGAGDTATPTWINFGCYWCVQIPLAWYLAQHLGPRGVYLAICGAESLLAVVSVILFRRGKWKTVAV